MTDAFDPHYEWLGIRPEERPITHYRLLGIANQEDNLNVIQEAADRQMAHLKSHQAGKYSKQSQQLLNEVAKACQTLLQPESKKAYDQQLKSSSAKPAPSKPTPSEPAVQAAPLINTSGNSTRRPSTGKRTTNHAVIAGAVGVAAVGA
ncbi:MAG: hypothetical protein N2C14_04535, partial [Planctomycetales bacterium]